MTDTMLDDLRDLRAKDQLEKTVKGMLEEYAEDYDGNLEEFLNDLFHGGCQSGLISELIYYKDTTSFYQRHKKEIGRLLADTLEETGFKSPSELFGDKWNTEDPLAQEDMNQNLLTWFAFEETARKLAYRIGYQG